MSVDMDLLRIQAKVIPEIMNYVEDGVMHVNYKNLPKPEYRAEELHELLSGIKQFLEYFHEANQDGALVELYDATDDTMHCDNASTSV